VGESRPGQDAVVRNLDSTLGGNYATYGRENFRSKEVNHHPLPTGFWSPLPVAIIFVFFFLMADSLILNLNPDEGWFPS
jgi:hypothetical protein